MGEHACVCSVCAGMCTCMCVYLSVCLHGSPQSSSLYAIPCACWVLCLRMPPPPLPGWTNLWARRFSCRAGCNPGLGQASHLPRHVLALPFFPGTLFGCRAVTGALRRAVVACPLGHWGRRAARAAACGGSYAPLVLSCSVLSSSLWQASLLSTWFKTVRAVCKARTSGRGRASFCFHN